MAGDRDARAKAAEKEAAKAAKRAEAKAKVREAGDRRALQHEDRLCAGSICARLLRLTCSSYSAAARTLFLLLTLPVRLCACVPACRCRCCCCCRRSLLPMLPTTRSPGMHMMCTAARRQGRGQGLQDRRRLA